MAEETTPNEQTAAQAPRGKTAGEDAPPSTVEEQAPSIVEEHLKSTSEAASTDIPTANAPDPTAVNPEVNPNATGEKSSTEVSTPDETASQDKPPKKSAAAAKAADDKPAAKAAKKEKGPAVEDKPFAEFVQQDYLPALQKALTTKGAKDINLKFEKQKVAIAGYSQEECWQIEGNWQNGLRQFNVYFPQENIQGQRAFSCNEGSKPSTLESFLIDERKVTLDLLVFGVVQRLDGQKWLSRN
ncbi:DUF2996 domain-containing protein [Aliterella atlantica]|uniref:DUF2996 domain-containing protein n=1 Tax=Aliterella atlantica CENA595 TaxID=1618023 RepID=A0A0D8ZWH2_9CYAN|nr:DUF2996 domain-containing protein [Aliterella atlantica]KJH73105.1 hypothetical protein UH38_03325 [Aliterella atlantica CENA595]